MWTTKVLRQFQIAQNAAHPVLEKVIRAPYNKFLNTLFPVDTDFTVIPNFQEVSSTKGVEFVVTFEVFVENRPVLVLALKREADLAMNSKRASADYQLRN
ncbi:hypothetical protein FA13DRAFT_1784306 [Coprinellus micaceus]|uniref:Uncharacterized protein n=1 Tax=Coprinellus micaceus TaxID=71717 RepID=A0A4Y7TZK0_COPMI|nr:hypothetical protein FA13DRAFT_1784306 [Coprinellus micaceus]